MGRGRERGREGGGGRGREREEGGRGRKGGREGGRGEGKGGGREGGRKIRRKWQGSLYTTVNQSYICPFIRPKMCALYVVHMVQPADLPQSTTQHLSRSQSTVGLIPTQGSSIFYSFALHCITLPLVCIYM